MLSVFDCAPRKSLCLDDVLLDGVLSDVWGRWNDFDVVVVVVVDVDACSRSCLVGPSESKGPLVAVLLLTLLLLLLQLVSSVVGVAV